MVGTNQIVARACPLVLYRTMPRSLSNNNVNSHEPIVFARLIADRHPHPFPQLAFDLRLLVPHKFPRDRRMPRNPADHRDRIRRQFRNCTRENIGLVGVAYSCLGGADPSGSCDRSSHGRPAQKSRTLSALRNRTVRPGSAIFRIEETRVIGSQLRSKRRLKPASSIWSARSGASRRAPPGATQRKPHDECRTFPRLTLHIHRPGHALALQIQATSRSPSPRPFSGEACSPAPRTR